MRLNLTLVVGIVVFGVAMIAAQKQHLAFDVVSIRPNNSGNPGSDTSFPPGGGFKATNVWLKLLIRIAYGLPAYQVTGGDNWTGSITRFDIEAKAEGNPSREQVLAMIQTVLAERFKLQFHRVRKEDSVYNLVVAKGGPRFKPVPDNGTGQHNVEASRGTITAKNGEISRFAWFLTQILDRQVVDRTGLNGFYDFTFVQPTAVLPSPDSTEPTTFDALEDQLGLRLEPGKTPVEFFVIDRATLRRTTIVPRHARRLSFRTHCGDADSELTPISSANSCNSTALPPKSSESCLRDFIFSLAIRRCGARISWIEPPRGANAAADSSLTWSVV